MTQPNVFSSASLLKAATLLVLFILLITYLCRLAAEIGFGLSLDEDYWHRDFLGNLSVALICALLVRSLWKTMLLGGVIIIFFQLGNAAKLSILGTPASPDDFFNIQNFFFLTDGWRRGLLFLIASIPFVLALVLISWKQTRTWLSLAVIASVVTLSAWQSERLRIMLDTQFGNSVWNQPANFRERGLALHLVQESLRTASKVEKPPNMQAVQSAQSALAAKLESNTSRVAERVLEPQFSNMPEELAGTNRNVHVFVLESFFDPVSLGEDWVPEDPLAEEFRQLWAQTAQSKIMSPVFGGYTANAEFEALCGFPVTRNSVFFEGWLRKKSPCLPHILEDAGYATVASHPNVPGFWNRTNAYQYVGFDTYLSKADFDLSDSVDWLLTDKSLYEQVFQYLETADIDQPVFNYMLTYHGHLPYPSSDNYPDKVSAGKESGLLHGYLNQMWYKSRHLMERVKLLREQDPDALIVIFGDHLPYLGPNYGVYSEAWNLPDDRSEFSGQHLQQLNSTPLIIIDGENGPLKLGTLPLYRLPSIIMSLLGKHDKQHFDATRNPEGVWIRPMYGMHISVTSDSAVGCVDQKLLAAPCKNSDSWLDSVKVIIRDTFTGRQYSLE